MKYLLVLLLTLSALHAQGLERIYTKGEYIFSVKAYKNGIQTDLNFFATESEGESQFDFKAQLPKINKVAFLGLQLTGSKLKNGQEMIHWNYYDANHNRLSKETTGLIQNASRLWLHPPRAGIFRMLELNPFPEVRFQEKLWSTSLEVGDSWADERWAVWQGKLNVQSTYNYTKSNGIIYAQADTGVGLTDLHLQFDPVIGVKILDFKTINGTRIFLEYVKFKKE